MKSWVLKKFQDDSGKPLDLVNASASARYGFPLSLWTYDQALHDKLNSVLYVPSVSAGASIADCTSEALKLLLSVVSLMLLRMFERTIT